VQYLPFDLFACHHICCCCWGGVQVMFSKPLPEFSCKLNALATALTCQWLMGPCKVNDVELDDGTVRRQQQQQCHSAVAMTCQ
jgi:hypothetical protein